MYTTCDFHRERCLPDEGSKCSYSYSPFHERIITFRASRMTASATPDPNYPFQALTTTAEAGLVTNRYPFFQSLRAQRAYTTTLSAVARRRKYCTVVLLNFILYTFFRNPYQTTQLYLKK